MTTRKEKQQPQISGGAGAAIVGIWLAAAVIAVGIAMATASISDKLIGGDLTFVILVAITVPVVAAYWITKFILGRVD